MVEFLLEIITYGGQGWLFYCLIEPVFGQTTKERKGRIREAFICMLPFLCFKTIISRISLVQRVMYGDVYMRSSKETIITAVFCYFELFLSGLALAAVKGRQAPKSRRAVWGSVLTLTFVFAAVSEMMLFVVYCVTRWMPQLAMDRLNQAVLVENAIQLEEYRAAADMINFLWNILFSIPYMIGSWLAIQSYRRCLVRAGRSFLGYEMGYLAMPALTGLGVGFFVRSILINMKDGEIHLVLDENPELYAVVPVISILCILLMLSSVRLRCRLIADEEEKSRLLIQENRVKDMEDYIRDLEQMEQGICGFRHDMKNYVADIQALLRLDGGGTQDAAMGCRAEIRGELEQYLKGMEDMLEEIVIHEKTGNPVTDVIVNRFRQQAGQAGITVECSFRFPAADRLNAFDLSVILNNGLNNALEACEKLAQGERWVTLKSRSREQIFLMEIQNPAPENLVVEPGQGLANIRNCVEKYHGHMEWAVERQIFRLTVMLPNV